MWEEFDPATDCTLCLKADEAGNYPIGKRVLFNDVEFAVAHHQPLRGSVFIYFKPVDQENGESDS
jgi:hypothetical protein